MSDAISRPERALRELTRLRYRRRRIRFLDGVLRLVVLACLLVWFTFFIDWTLDLPVGVRVVQSAAALFFLVLGLRVFVRSTRRGVSDAWLAAQVESSTGSLHEALLTAIQLSDPKNPRARYYSPALLERTIREVEEKIEEIRAERLVSKRGLATSAGILAFLVPTLVVGAWLKPDLARTYVERDVLFQSSRWPRRYLLEVIAPTERVTQLPAGSSFTIEVHRLRGGSARVTMNVTFVDGAKDSITLGQLGDQRFEHTFPNVTRDLRFELRCGDWRSDQYEVVVRNRPRVEEIVLAFTYPEYTGLNELVTDGTIPDRQEGGHAKVPVDTLVDFEARTSIPVERAVWVYEYLADGAQQRREMPLELGTDKTLLTGRFRADVRGQYSFELVSDDGYPNPDPIPYRMSTIPNNPPLVQIERPGRNLEVTANASVRIEVSARDDYGVVGAALALKRERTSEDAPAESIAQYDLGPFEPGQKEVRSEVTIELSELSSPIEPGHRLEYLAEAEDLKGREERQLGLSRTYGLSVVTPDEMTRILQDELTLVRESLEQTQDLEKRAIRELLTALGAASDPLALTDVRAVAEVRRNQESIERRIREAGRRLDEVLQRIVDNRLVWNELPRIQGISRRLNAVISDLVPPSIQTLAEVVEAGEGLARREQIPRGVDAARAIERALKDILIDLREWSDLSSITQKLEEALLRQKELQRRVREKIKERH